MIVIRNRICLVFLKEKGVFMKILSRLTTIMLILFIFIMLTGCEKKDTLYTVSSRQLYGGDIVLDADDAYYFDPPIVLEGDSLKNLSQWKGAARAYWGFTVPEYGTYDITLVYSRADGPEVRCILKAEARKEKNKWKEYAELARDLSPTGEDTDDWSEYVEYFTSGFYDLPAGTELRLSLY